MNIQTVLDKVMSGIFKVVQYLVTNQFPIGWFITLYEIAADKMLTKLNVPTKKWMNVKGVCLALIGIVVGLAVVHLVSDILGFLIWLMFFLIGIWFIMSGLASNQ